jgi:hypothetical protein
MQWLKKKTVMVNQTNCSCDSLGIHSLPLTLSYPSLVLLVEKTEENNRPVRKSLTNYQEVVSSTPRQRKRLEHFL